MLLVLIIAFFEYDNQQLKQSVHYAFAQKGIKVGNYPVDIVVNSNTKRSYVTNQFSDTVSVINTQTDEIIETIDVGSFPYGIDIDEISNRVYVANYGSGSLSVIDGSTNKLINTIEGFSFPTRIVINDQKSLAYVINNAADNYILSIVDLVNNKILNNKTLNYPSPFDITFFDKNRNTDLIFVSHSFVDQDRRSFTSVLTSKLDINNITLTIDDPIIHDNDQLSSTGLAIDQEKNLLYVTHKDSDSISIYDITSNITKLKRLINLEKGSKPTGIVIFKNYENRPEKLFVSNIGNIDNSSVSVIELLGDKYQLKENIPVDSIGWFNKTVKFGKFLRDINVIPTLARFPNVASFLDIEYDRQNDEAFVYLTNTVSNEVSIIDAEKEKLLIGLNFNIHPSNAGKIICNNQEVENYKRYELNEYLTCSIKGNGFPELFFSIAPPIIAREVEAKKTDSNEPLFKFPSLNFDGHFGYRVDQFNTLNAEFLELPEVFNIASLAIVIISTLVAIFYSKRELFLKKRVFNQYNKRINNLDNLPINNIKEYNELLYELKKNIRILFLNEKIDQYQYKYLIEKIYEYERNYNN